MAEKLLGAIARGTYQAATAPLRGVKEALDPKIMQTMYRAGIIGPVLRSIASNYNAKDEKGNVQNNAITANVSKNLQAMSFQLSAIADIMEDIRELTKNQIKLDKEGIKTNERLLKRSDIKAYEEKLESRTPISSLMPQGSQSQGGKSDTPFVGGLLGNVLGFAKDNPIFTGLLGGLIFAAWPDLQKKFQEFVEKSGIDKDLQELKDNIYSSIKSGIQYIVKNILDQLGFPGLFKQDGQSPNGSQQSGISGDVLTGGVVGGIASKLLLGKTLPGVVGGAIYGAMGDSEYAGEAAVAGAVGTLAGGALLKRKMEQAKLNKAVEKAMQARGIGPVTPAATPTVPSPTPTVPTQPSSGIIVEESYGRRGRETIARDERKDLKDESKKSLSKLVDRINAIAKKYPNGKTRLYVWLAKKVGMSLGASLIGGPIGLLIGILSLGFSILQIAEWLDDFEKGAEASEASQTMGSTFDMETGDYGNRQNLEQAVESRVTTPPVTSLIPSQSDMDFNYEDYRNRIMQLESGGRNIPSGTGGSAFGLYQITKETFDRIKKKYPEFKDVDFNDMKSNTEVQNRVFDRLTQENVKYLKSKGIEPTPLNLYLAHRLGAPAAANILKAQDSNANLIETAYKDSSFKFKSQVYNQNPDMQNVTVSEFLNKRAAAFVTTSPFAPEKATPTKDPMDLINELTGLRSIIDVMKEMKIGSSPIVDASTTVNNNSRGSEARSAAPTVSPHSLTKDQLRALAGPGLRYQM